jgi:hypothetical protein
MTLGITTLGKVKFSITIRKSDTQHYNNLCPPSVITLSVTIKSIMLRVIVMMFNVAMLDVVAPLYMTWLITKKYTE